MCVLTWAATLAFSGLYSRTPDTLELHILHTNDLHSRIEPFDVGSGFASQKGGAARRAFIIRTLRSKAKQLLLLDAGDALQGTPYFSSFKGVLDYQIMNRMGYDAGTLGNHEFDLGISGLEAALAIPNFPLVNCNYDFSAFPKLASQIRPYIIKEIQGFKIAITGVGIPFKGLVSEGNCAGVRYRDPITSLKKIITELRKNKGADMVIVLSHLGTVYHQARVDDLRLARAVKGIDLIIGGHTHTSTHKPICVNNKGWVTHLVQGYTGGIQIGHLVFDLQHSKGRSLVLK